MRWEGIRLHGFVAQPHQWQCLRRTYKSGKPERTGHDHQLQIISKQKGTRNLQNVQNFPQKKYVSSFQPALSLVGLRIRGSYVEQHPREATAAAHMAKLCCESLLYGMVLMVSGQVEMHRLDSMARIPQWLVPHPTVCHEKSNIFTTRETKRDSR